MGIQASTVSSLASPTLVTPVHDFPSNVGFQAGHMGLLNLAAYLPGFRSLHPGTFSSPAAPNAFWNVMEQPATMDKSGAFFDANLPLLRSMDWLTLAADTLGHQSLRVSQPIGSLGEDGFDTLTDQSDLSILFRDEEECCGGLSDGNGSWSTLGSPCLGRTSSPGGTHAVPDMDGPRSGTSTRVTSPAPEFLSAQEHHKRCMPDSGDYERVLKMARIGEQTESRARLAKEESDLKTAVKGPGGKPARRKRPRTAEVMERSRLESARARERRKFKRQNLERVVQERSERALALQQQVQILQAEAATLRNALQAQFGICIPQGALHPMLAQMQALTAAQTAASMPAVGASANGARPIAIRPRADCAPVAVAPLAF